MTYKKIKLSFDDAKSRFNRTVLVNKDINLVKLGCVFCTALGAEFEHNFLFRAKKNQYLPDAFMHEFIMDPEHELPMKNYTLKDLGSSFTFLYDTGDNWEFECKVADKEIEKEGNRIAYLVGGKGQGIWEDNAYSLRCYLDGEIDPNCDTENEDEGIFFPWNYMIEKFGDFDTDFDIKDAQEEYDLMVYDDMNDYLDECHDNGFELEVEGEDDPDESQFDMIEKTLPIIVLAATDSQIKHNEAIKKVYKNLSEKYDEQKAFLMIAAEMENTILQIISADDPSSNYIERLKKLK